MPYINPDYTPPQPRPEIENLVMKEKMPDLVVAMFLKVNELVEATNELTRRSCECHKCPNRT